MTEQEQIIGVEDHGMWRGHRSWTVRIDGPTGRAAVSVRDETTEAGAIAQARQTYRNARKPSDEERAAMQAANEALIRGLLS